MCDNTETKINAVMDAEFVPNLFGPRSLGDGRSNVAEIHILESDIPNLREVKSGRVREPFNIPTVDGKCVTVKIMIHLKNVRTDTTYVLFGTSGAIKLVARMNKDKIGSKVKNCLKMACDAFKK